MRDITKVVLAEDDTKRADELRRILEVTGGYSVWVVRRTRDIMDRLAETNAAWLILDLELEDEPSIGIPVQVRGAYGSDVMIIVLTGHFNTYPEQRMLADGVLLALRKPYSPTALLAQMKNFHRFAEGRAEQAVNGIVLELADGRLDLHSGIYRGRRGTISLNKTQVLLFNLLARSRNTDGWASVERGELLIGLWGEDGAQDPARSGDRLRKLQQRLRAMFGEKVIIVKRGDNHTTNYAFSEQVVLVNGGSDATA